MASGVLAASCAVHQSSEAAWRAGSISMLAVARSEVGDCRMYASGAGGAGRRVA